MEHIDVVCPDPQFKKFVRDSFDRINKCLSNKISWTMAGVIVAIFSVVAFLVYEAYSGEQKRQCSDVLENRQDIQRFKINVSIMEVKFGYIKDQLEDLKKTQETNFKTVVEKLEKIQSNESK